ncbi:hypothetical protein, partial [Gemmiger sp.]|uniref:hypothetical protein n=1 Tax=Gemmiger sp. TaxID=2049027 RepID=UPI003AB6566E
PVKMRLERSAERDKREIKIILPLNMRKAHAARIPNRPAPPGAFLRSAQKSRQKTGTLAIDEPCRAAVK